MEGTAEGIKVGKFVGKQEGMLLGRTVGVFDGSEAGAFKGMITATGAAPRFAGDDIVA